MSEIKGIEKYYKGTGFTLLALLLWGGFSAFNADVSFNFDIFIAIFVLVFVIETITNLFGIWFLRQEATK